MSDTLTGWMRAHWRLRIASALSAAFATLLLSVAPPVEAARKALVIGNDSYEAIDKLRNARTDADAMAVALTRAGYAVTLKKDRTLRQMKDAIREFRTGISGGDEVILYFSGHGVQIGGVNYLLPVDVRAQVEDQVRDDSVALADLLADIAVHKPALTLAIVDACRDNPFPKRGRAIGGRGLTAVAGATGQMIIYSAGVGQQALDRLGDKDPIRNGLFTRVFVREMERPGVPINEVVRSVREEVYRQAQAVRHEQVPAIYDQVLGQFYFYAPNSSIVVNSLPPPAAVIADPAALELAFWNSIGDSKDSQEFAAYLEQYPAGQFSALAKIRQKQLRLPVTAVPQASLSVKPRETLVSFAGEAAGEATARTIFGSEVVFNRFNLRAAIESEILKLLRSEFPRVRLDANDHQGDATRVKVAVTDIFFRNNRWRKGYDATAKLAVSVSSGTGAARVERFYDLAVHGKDNVALFLRNPDRVSRDMLAQLPDLLSKEIVNKMRILIGESEVRSIAAIR